MIISGFCKQEELNIETKEVLRYLGYSRESITEKDEAFAMSMIDKFRGCITPGYCYGRFDIKLGEDGRIEMPYGIIHSHDLTRNLSECDAIYLFAVTLGIGPDRAIKRAYHISMAEAAYCQAIGAAATEALCEKVISILKKQTGQDYVLKPRYSPGFGDYTLVNQKGIFGMLTPEKYIGLTLNDSLVMAPEKSVTAVVGIKHAH